LCYADIVNYGVTPNGGGIMKREYLSYVSDDSYIGVGSILVGPGSIGNHFHMETSGIFYNYWVQDNVTLRNSSIAGIDTIQSDSSVENSVINGMDGKRYIGW